MKYIIGWGLLVLISIPIFNRINRKELTRTCPNCRETFIDDDMGRCPHCGGVL